jgi:hypothetical protein
MLVYASVIVTDNVCAHIGKKLSARILVRTPTRAGRSEPCVLTHSSSASKFRDTLEGKILYYAGQVDVIGIHKDCWKKHLMIAKAE